MKVPNTYTDKNETGCCAVPDVVDWDEREIVFENKLFIRMYTRSFLFVPLNMGSVMKKIQKTAEDAGATMPPEQAMTLTSDLSSWKAEQLYAVSTPVEGADNVALNGTFMTKVFEGEYKNAKTWYDSLQEFAKSKGKTPKKTYFFYTTCPKCAKYYGKNYVIGLVEVV